MSNHLSLIETLLLSVFDEDDDRSAAEQVAALIKLNEQQAAQLAAVEAVQELKLHHQNTWRDRPESYWLSGLLEEIAELGMAIHGEHEHTPDTELEQIAAIALNWLEMRASSPQPQPAPDPVREFPMMGLCQCGHEYNRHDSEDTHCDIYLCQCTYYSEASR